MYVMRSLRNTERVLRNRVAEKVVEMEGQGAGIAELAPLVTGKNGLRVLKDGEVDVGLMAQNVLLAAESQGLGGVYIGGIRNDPQVVVDQLRLPSLVAPVFGMCLGWPDEANEVKPRMPVEFVLHEDVYRDVPATDMAGYDAQMAAYYAARGANVKLSDWSQAVASAMQGKKREHMREFLQGRGFFLR